MSGKVSETDILTGPPRLLSRSTTSKDKHITKKKKTLRNKSGIHERGIYGLSEQQ